MPGTTSITIKKGDADHIKTFGEIEFSKAGTYTYTVKETKGTLGGVTYDETEHTVTIKVKGNEDGTLVADGTDLIQTVQSTNTYSATGTGEILVTKTLTGRDWLSGDAFTFMLEPVHGMNTQNQTITVPMPAATTVTITSANTTKSFGEITFTEAGTYIYKVSESYTENPYNGITYNVDENGVRFADNGHEITIKVKDNGDGRLVADGTDLIRTVEFINTYDAKGTITFEGTKALEGGDLKAGQFSFALLDENGEVIETVSNAADGSFSFPAITYTLKDLGEHKYTVKEVIPEDADEDVTYDDTVYEVTVTVTDNEDGSLKAEPSKNAENLSFTNKVTSDSVSVEFSGKKNLKKFTGQGAPVFTFQLFEIVDGEEVLAASAQTKGSGRYTFPKITYTSADIGTHEYVVRELQGNAEGVTYDDKEYRLTVTVYKDGEDKLIAEISGDNPERLNFVNEYEKPHLPKTGFSSTHAQVLPEQPKDIGYKPLRWRLEIPVLSLSADIVEVPLVDNEYPVTWLGESAGLLEGSSLPGEGHTLITGHNHLNTTEAGPFALLQTLSNGDRIFVTDPEYRLQIFEVYLNTKISEYDFSGLYEISNAEERSLTLITCEDQRTNGGYENRRIIAARPVD